LQKITQFGADGSEFNHHTFDYFDEVGTPSGITIFGGDVGVPGAGTTAGSDILVAGVNGTAFSGEANDSHQTHLYTGVAIGPQKELSGGAKVGANTDDSHLSQILIDLNGDGRVDQVFVSGSGVRWRPNIGSPTAPSFGMDQPVQGLEQVPVVNKS